MISTSRKKPNRDHRPSPVCTECSFSFSFFLLTRDLGTYSRWTHTSPSPTKRLPDRQHTLVFPSLLTPGGHLQILISADLSKLKHKPSFHNRAKWSTCEWLHNHWTKSEKNYIFLNSWQNMSLTKHVPLKNIHFTIHNIDKSLRHSVQQLSQEEQGPDINVKWWEENMLQWK